MAIQTDQREPTRESDPTRNLGILVETCQTLGTGLTLVRAFRVILTEPDYVASTEEQANARICRIGQQNPEASRTDYLLPNPSWRGES
jgi:hypothetical protein